MTQEQRSMPIRWLGLDPSLAAFGWAVMASDGNTSALLGLGTFSTAKDKTVEKITTDTDRRFIELVDGVKGLLERIEPQAVFVERHVLIPRMGVYANSTKGRLRGIVEALCSAYGVPLQSFDPQALRRHLGLERGAEKSEVEAKVRKKHAREIAQLGDKFDDNAFDAAAIAMLGGYHESVDFYRRELRRNAQGEP